MENQVSQCSGADTNIILKITNEHNKRFKIFKDDTISFCFIQCEIKRGITSLYIQFKNLGVANVTRGQCRDRARPVGPRPSSGPLRIKKIQMGRNLVIRDNLGKRISV